MVENGGICCMDWALYSFVWIRCLLMTVTVIANEIFVTCMDRGSETFE